MLLKFFAFIQLASKVDLRARLQGILSSINRKEESFNSTLEVDEESASDEEIMPPSECKSLVFSFFMIVIYLVIWNNTCYLICVPLSFLWNFFSKTWQVVIWHLEMKPRHQHLLPMNVSFFQVTFLRKMNLCLFVFYCLWLL